MAALFSSALWYGFQLTIMLDVWIFVVTESLFFQELSRWLFWYLYSISLRSKLMESKQKSSKLGEEISIGAGVAAAHGIIMFGSILWDSRGPGSYYIPSCPRISLFLSSSITTCLISILDIFWTIIAYEGYRSRSYAKIVFVWVAHFGSSFIVSCYNCFFLNYLLIFLFVFLEYFKYISYCRNVLDYFLV